MTFRRLIPLMAGLVVTGVLLGLAQSSSGWRKASLDLVADTLQQLNPRPYQPLPVKIVDIDDRSLEQLGQWPWSRDIFARLTDRMRELGAAVVTYDVLFAEADRSSPEKIARSYPEAFPAGSDFSKLPDHDRTFAAAIAKMPVVLPIGLTAKESAGSLALKTSIATLGDDPLAGLPGFSGAISNIPALEAAASGLATFSFASSGDNIVRRVPLLSTYNGTVIPALGLESLRVATGAKTLAVKATDGADGRELAIKVGSTIIRTDRSGQLRLQMTGHQADRFVSVADLFDAGQEAALTEKLKGAIVLVGTSAVGLVDLRSTALDSFLPGVEVHAELIEHLMLGHAIDRPDWAPGMEWLLAGFLGILATLAGQFLRSRLAMAGLAVILGGLAVAVDVAYAGEGMLFDPMLAGAVVLAASAVTIFLRFVLIDREGRLMKAAFQQYLSPALVEELARNGRSIRLGGESRVLSCLFTDLEGFTAFSENAPPETLVRVLNAYLDGLCRVAMDEGGTVLKLIGDAVNVVFNAPLNQPDHAARAIQCALAMDRFAESYRQKMQAEGIPFGHTRIGIATGPAVVGNFGGSIRFDYTAYGDTMNTAARLEAANKALGTRICVSEKTALDSGLPEARLRPVGALIIRGKAEPVSAYEPLTEGADSRGFRSLVSEIAADPAAAVVSLERYRSSHPEDRFAGLIEERLKSGRDPLTISV